MCILSKESLVSNTTITSFVLDVKGERRQFITYSNNVAIKDPATVMILPFPSGGIDVHDPRDFDATSFIRHLDEMYVPKLRSYGVTKRGGDVMLFDYIEKDVGSYRVQIFEKISQLIMASEVLSLDKNIVELLSKNYDSSFFGAVVCRLIPKGEHKYEPLTISSRLGSDGKRFIPTKHAGHEPDWDHTLFFLNAGSCVSGKSWIPSSLTNKFSVFDCSKDNKLDTFFTNLGRNCSDKQTILYKKVTERFPNEDLWVA